MNEEQFLKCCEDKQIVVNLDDSGRVVAVKQYCFARDFQKKVSVK